MFGFKPIETGCSRVDGKLMGADQEADAVAAGDWQKGPLRGLYQFEAAVAPFVAAAGASIDLAAIQTIVMQQRVDLVLVEGAGGWRVPITAEDDMGSLAKRLRLPILVVARAGLGTINHTLLTLEAIERDQCKVAGVVLSQLPSDDDALAASNQTEIVRRWSGTVLRFVADESVLDCFI